MYKRYFKRFLDFTLSAIALLILFVPLVIVTICLHFANKGAGAFFFQERPGKNGKIFRIVKFKTMTDEKDENNELLPDEQRLTKIGRIVRSTSIDELPQLWNVLVGDMSLIGPRPLLVKYLPWYTEEEQHRHDVRPGITGYAQVNGRNHCIWPDRLALDVYYVKNLSFGLDAKIVLKTIKNVLSRKDIAIVPDSMDFDHYRNAVLKKAGISLLIYETLPPEEQHTLAMTVNPLHVS